MKKAVVLLIILAALIALAMMSEKGRKQRVNSAGLFGAPNRELVLPEVSDKEIGGLRIREGEKKVNLSLADGRWTVAERSNYPASFDKVQRAVKFVSELKVKGKQVVGKTVLGEVKLLAPGDGPAEQTGLLVELQDAKGAEAASLIVGGSTSTSGGASASGSNMFGGPGELRYARIPGWKDGDTAWFVEDSFYELNSDPKDWLDKSFVDIRKLEKAEITPPDAAQAWKAERKDEDSPYTLVNAAPGEEIDTAKVDGLNSVLSGAMFSDVVPKDKVTPEFMKDAVKAKLVTSDGFTYDIQAISKKEGGADATEKNYVSVKVSADIAKERKAPADEKPEDKTKNDEAFAATKKSLEDKLAKEKTFDGWVFEVPNYTVAVVFKKRSEILRDKQPAAPLPAEGAPPAPSPGATPGPVRPPTLQPPPAIPGPSATSPSATSGPGPGPAATPASQPAAKPADAPPPAADAKPANATPPAAEAKPASTTPPATGAKPADAKPAEPKPDDKPADPEAPQPNPAPATPPAKPPGQ